MFLVWENDTGEIEITLIKIVEDFILDPGINHISKKEATDESVVGLKLFEKPVIGYASSRVAWKMLRLAYRFFSHIQNR